VQDVNGKARLVFGVPCTGGKGIGDFNAVISRVAAIKGLLVSVAAEGRHGH
jgi:hypothetical protein